jgi:hypothetical protein
VPHDHIDDSPLFCARCSVELRPGEGNFYQVTIEAVADPFPPDVSDEELARDHRREIERLLAAMEGMSERELLDQVHRRMLLHLCGPCYGEWIENPTG